jgi:hypothetical protein
VLFRIIVKQLAIHLAQDQARWIASVVNADYKFIHLNVLLILKSLRPMPCASNQWISASSIVPSASWTVALPFILRQRPLP